MNSSKQMSNDSSYQCLIFVNYGNELLIQSVFLDLIGGIILCGLAYRFYQGIEISHPVYSVLFSNIVYSLISSFISFVGNVYQYIDQSCDITWLLTIYNNTNISAVTIVSWTTISILRYLLITAKIEDKVDDLNLPRIRNISLIVNWSIILVFMILRGILQIPFHDNASFLGRLIIPILGISFVATTFSVYYKMDIDLKATVASQCEIQNELGKRKSSGKFTFVVLD